MYSNLNTTILSKLDLEKLLSFFCRFSVGFLSMFASCCDGHSFIACRCLLGFLSILYYCARSQEPATSPICACGFVHPRVVPLIVSSHLWNVPFIVLRIKIIICNQPCTVLSNTIITSKLDLEKLLSVFCRFSVGVCSVLCRIILYFLSMHALVFCQCSVHTLSVLSCVFTGTSTSPLCACGFVHPQVVPLILLYRPTYWTSHLCMINENNIL